MKTLLSKTHQHLFVCMSMAFVLSAPLFYLITKHYYAEDLAEIVESVQHGGGIPMIDLEEDIMTGVMLQFVLVFAIVGLSFLITMHYITRDLWAPFDDTLRKTEQFNLAQGGIPEFVPSDVSEFQRLNHSLVKLMRKDSEAFRIQKEFSENASHELQTPLAVMRGKLDLLMQESLDQNQMHIVDDLYQLVTRMNRLNSNLLLLAKIDNAQYLTTEEADIGELAAAQVALCTEVQPHATISVSDRRSVPHPVLRLNAALTESLLKNLLVNAVRHSAQGSAVSMELYDDHVVVSNPSDDGKPLNGSTLFQRFRHTSMGRGGNGLGLAIVKAVCDFHGWQVGYSFAGGRHSFTVTFHRQ